mmetsp:Transcript_6305/g.19042  ORF Transcript_6305/g.19042 Transcript_6305/m.19042 type:complete len:280 (-) Transcript_6305:311-1150(-)
MLLHKVIYFVYNAVENDEDFSLFGPTRHIFPPDNRKFVDGLSPVDLGLHFVELRLLDLYLRLANLVFRKSDELRRLSDQREELDDPLCRVIVIPENAVAIVVRKLVVIVVVSLAKGDQRGQNVVIGGVSRRVGLCPKSVCKRVHTEGRLMDKEHSAHACVDECAPKVVPENGGDGQRQNERKRDRDRQVVVVLPHDQLVFVEVGDVNPAAAALFLLPHHPSDMRKPEALVHGIGVLLGVNVSVMGPVVPRPPPDRSLERSCPVARQQYLHRERSIVALV